MNEPKAPSGNRIQIDEGMVKKGGVNPGPKTPPPPPPVGQNSSRS
jgi:hypothetical protein